MNDFVKLLSEMKDTTTTNSDVPLPPVKKVIMYNDDFTTMEFVVEILQTVFIKPFEEANYLMRTIHNSGSAVIGEYTYDIAVSRKNLATHVARENGFPLRIEVE